MRPAPGQIVSGTALSGLAALALASAVAPPLALINESPSLPVGLYLRDPGAQPGPGAVVAAVPPPGARAYLARLGAPAEARLLKRVAAVGGQQVCAHPGQLLTPDRRVKVRSHDRQGAVLPIWRGCRVLEPDELILLGDTPGSFDSRYFGPVRRADLDGVYRRALAW